MTMGSGFSAWWFSERRSRVAFAIAVFAVLPVRLVAQSSESAVTPLAIAQRLADLIDPKGRVPENEYLLYEENSSLRREANDYRRALGEIGSQTPLLHEADTAIARLDSAVAVASGQSCPSLVERSSPILRRARLWLAATDFDQGRWNEISMPRTGTPPDCVRLAAQLKDSSLLSSLRATLLQARSDAERQRVADEKFSGDLTSLIARVEQRRAAIQQALSAADSQQYLGRNLWVIILSIGGLSIAIMLVVRQFPEGLQAEWVTSGQVTQFVTVVVLLVTLIALGAATILHEETLGTLLGAIAGYVLSQGVGRSAAQEAIRGSKPAGA
jgi:hypothetical protein